VTRPTYCIKLRAIPGTDPIRALRSLLKAVLRRHGLQCINAIEHPGHRRRRRPGADQRAEKGKTMDMSQYKGSAFIKVKDVKDGPLVRKIVRVEEGRFEKPDLCFDDGSVLSLNATNVGILCRAYGDDSDDWIDQVVELRLGTITYKGTENEAVLVKPVSTVAVSDDEVDFGEVPPWVDAPERDAKR
jgi:hypothetical protein